MTDLGLRVAAVAGLSHLCAAGLPIRHALSRWPDVAPAGLARDIGAVARALPLCGDTETALRRATFLGDDLDAVIAICRADETVGLDGGRALSALAAAIEARSEQDGSAKAAIAGTRLQARMVAGLPLLALFLAPAAHVPLFDPAGLVTIAVGGALVCAGMRWMTRLIPNPATTDNPTALMADLIAAISEAGAPLPLAVTVAAGSLPWQARLLGLRAQRLMALGFSPSAALYECDDDMRSVASALKRSEELGTPVAHELHALATHVRSHRRQQFESAVRRAPVRMVLPLTLCVLPAFGILGITPFLRSLT